MGLEHSQEHAPVFVHAIEEALFVIGSRELHVRLNRQERPVGGARDEARQFGPVDSSGEERRVLVGKSVVVVQVNRDQTLLGRLEMLEPSAPDVAVP